MNLGDYLRDELEAAGLRYPKALTVLIADNDPFRQDVPRKMAPGQWLARQVIAARAAGRPRLHIRGWHYALLGRPDWNGQAYVNTYDRWAELGTKAFDGARWNGWLPFDEIVDQRNLPPVLRIREQVTPQPQILIPELELWVPDDLRPLPGLSALEDGEAEARQEHRLCIFGEKSSLEPVLGPISERYDTDLCLPTGEASESMVYALAKAAADDGRRLVVFYVADFDPSGWQMTISVTRKLQAHIIQAFPHLEVEVHRVGLTYEQVEQYREANDPLPETPLKEEEKRGDKWKQRWGVEQTEIDALATLRPDDLTDIVTEALDDYYDHTLADRVAEARREWATEAREAMVEQIGADVLEDLEEEARARIEEIRAAVEEVNEMLDIDTSDVVLPSYEPPEPHGAVGRPNPLFDSDDDFVTATLRLKADRRYATGEDDQ